MYFGNVDSVMEALGQQHDSNHWHIFGDSSKLRLKAVLLHNDNTYPLC
jgi:hypothetical protein